MRTSTRHRANSALAPILECGDAHTRWTQHLVIVSALTLLVGGMSAGGLSSLLLPQPPGRSNDMPAAAMAGMVDALPEREARQRATALCARVAGPSAISSEATLLVIHTGHGRPDRTEWRVDCRVDGGASYSTAYSVRLDARTGEPLAIARAVPWGTVGRSGRGDGDGWPSPGASVPLPASRAGALARRYLRAVGGVSVGSGVAAPLLAARPEVRRVQARLYQGYACTFHDSSSQPSSVRVDIDARDGSLDALYRQTTAPLPPDRRVALNSPTATGP
jgi:hypothetical protein